MEHTYAAIDLKSFYASVECVERGLDPLSVNLVVADTERTEKTICLAVSPSLKAYGIPGRPRLFEVISRVDEINRKRLRNAVRNGNIQKNEEGKYEFSGSSFCADALDADPSLGLSYITATPRMRLYEEYSTRIYSIYLKYIAPEDIHVYSIDEVFIDVTHYLKVYGMTAHELTMTMIRDVLETTGITATAGIGSNLYLAKVAMDIVAKHMPADKDGVRIAQIDENGYRRLLWDHKPLTDFWRVGSGICRKLNTMGIYTMGELARASMDRTYEELLYKSFGINAELLIDHAWGWEPVTISDIKSYRPSARSISSGQVLKEPYDCKKAGLIVREMAELLSHDLIRQCSVTKQLVMTIGYDRTSISAQTPGGNIRSQSFIVTTTGKKYNGTVVSDHYGRPQPAHSHGTESLGKYTASPKKIVSGFTELYERISDPQLLVRRITIAACGIISENDIPEDEPEQLELFADHSITEKRISDEKAEEEKERNLFRAVLGLKDRLGKNAVLRGMNLMEGATTIERNTQIGGHRS